MAMARSHAPRTPAWDGQHPRAALDLRLLGEPVVARERARLDPSWSLRPLRRPRPARTLGPRQVMRVAATLVATLLVSAFLEAKAETGGEIFDLLQPGSRPAVGVGGDPFLSPLDDATGWWSEFDWAAGRSLRVEGYASQPMSR